ncbi:TUTase domain-containing protein [Heracleum sosnowskyi]|uniref:TUTase domain-containing protein n=1 Tax=Heracleum sosnowskyi TaxID=360622 RepID=A0AAD8HZC5_9APIA|nr:TUTase domain-containing protein [Heracleum sosnowskyi]
MTVLREKVLRKKVEKLELKGLKIHKLIPEKLSGLEELLQDVFLILQPKPSDYQNRRDLVLVFNEIAKELYGKPDHPDVEEFGSFVMDLFSPTSDLDLSVNFSKDAAEYPRDKKIKALRKFLKKFYALQSRGHVSSVKPIFSARVPILKVVDAGTGVECDISVENRDGILKSQIVHMISSIDYRFQKLCFLMKTWAKVHNINSSKDGTLNSLSIILLVTFHLQTRNPPILPPLSALFKDGTDPASVMKFVKKYSKYGKGNEESLASLFLTLLIKLSSVSTLWCKGLCASAYQGAWISKTWNSEVGCISVEDFTDRSQNVARAVKEAEIPNINKAIELSIIYIFDFMDGLIEESKLRRLLFGCDATIPASVKRSTTNGEEKANLYRPSVELYEYKPSMQTPTAVWEGRLATIPFNPTLATNSESLYGNHSVVFSDPTATKKMRTTGGWGAKPAENWVGTSNGNWGGTSGGHLINNQYPNIVNPSMVPLVGWQSKAAGVRTQPTVAAERIWSEEMRGTGAWGNSWQANVHYNINNQVPGNSVSHGTSNPVLHQTFVTRDRNLMHGQPFNHRGSR